MNTQDQINNIGGHLLKLMALHAKESEAITRHLELLTERCAQLQDQIDALERASRGYKRVGTGR